MIFVDVLKKIKACSLPVPINQSQVKQESLPTCECRSVSYFSRQNLTENVEDFPLLGFTRAETPV